MRILAERTESTAASDMQRERACGGAVQYARSVYILCDPWLRTKFVRILAERTESTAASDMQLGLPAAELYNMCNPCTASEDQIITADSKDRNISAIRFALFVSSKSCRLYQLLLRPY